jgi:hypothetical protein
MAADKIKEQIAGWDAPTVKGHRMVKFLATGIVLFLVMGGTHGIALAQTDTPEARAKAVERYFQEVSMRALMNDMVKQVSQQIPPEQRDAFEDVLLRNVRLEVVEAAAKQSLAKHLTLAEIELFTEFIRRPEGKSAMEKMKYYMADLMPVIQQELLRAIKISAPTRQ